MENDESTVVREGQPGPEEELFDGRYRLIRVLGRGGMGEVRLVEDTLQENERVALKLILPEFTASPEFERRFRIEIKVLRSLQHTGIPQIYNDGKTASGVFYFTMAFVVGRPLNEILREPKQLTPRQTAEYVRQMVDILEYAHSRGVIHRDLKPANILIVDEGSGNDQVHILDFGIAKILSQDGANVTDETEYTVMPIGTPQYMSPEQARGLKIDGATDYYALGVLLYRVLTGDFPFGGANATQHMTARLTDPPRALPQTIKKTPMGHLIKRLMAFDPESRPRGDEVLKILGISVHKGGAMVPWPVLGRFLMLIVIISAGLIAWYFFMEQPSRLSPAIPPTLVPAPAKGVIPQPPVSSSSSGDFIAPLKVHLTALPGKADPQMPGRRLVRSDQTLLKGKIKSGTEVSDNLRVEINGQYIVLDSAGQFRYDVANLDDGTHSLNIVAEDESGQRVKKTVELLLDRQPPKLTVLTPKTALRTNKATLTLRLRVEDVNFARLSVDGHDQIVNTENETDVMLRLPQVGTQQVTIIATDRLGNRVTRKIEVTRTKKTRRQAPLPKGFSAINGAKLIDGLYEQIVHKHLGIKMRLVKKCNNTDMYYLSKHETTEKQFAIFLTQIGRNAGKLGKGAAQHLPVSNISVDDAKRFAQLAQTRLPTEKEWLCAAHGNQERAYPWGNEWQQKHANIREDASADGFSERAPVDTSIFADGKSWADIWNMTGNVSELVVREGKPFIIGGSYRSTATYARIGTGTPVFVADELTIGPDVGFRIAVNVPGK